MQYPLFVDSIKGARYTISTKDRKLNGQTIVFDLKFVTDVMSKLGKQIMITFEQIEFGIYGYKICDESYLHNPNKQEKIVFTDLSCGDYVFRAIKYYLLSYVINQQAQRIVQLKLPALHESEHVTDLYDTIKYGIVALYRHNIPKLALVFGTNYFNRDNISKYKYIDKVVNGLVCQKRTVRLMLKSMLCLFPELAYIVFEYFGHHLLTYYDLPFYGIQQPRSELYNRIMFTYKVPHY